MIRPPRLLPNRGGGGLGPSNPVVHAPGLGPGPYTASTRAGLMRHVPTLPPKAKAGAKVRGFPGAVIRIGRPSGLRTR